MLPTPRDESIAALRAAGRPIAAIALAVGVTDRSVYRALAKPDVAARVQEIRRAAVDGAVGRLGDLAANAVETLGELLDAEQQGAVRLGAAGRILSALLATRAAVDVEDRLAALETAAAAAEGGAR